MNESMPIFTVSKDSKCLKTFADYCFEVKDGDRILYHGDSFEKARQTYESPTPEANSSPQL